MTRIREDVLEAAYMQTSSEEAVRLAREELERVSRQYDEACVALRSILVESMGIALADRASIDNMAKFITSTERKI